jgi:hypothetical protein
MDNKLVTLEKYDMLYEAEFAKSDLEANGIKVMVVGEMLRGAYPQNLCNARRAFIELKVFASDVDKAKEILASQQNTENAEG